MCCGRPDTPEVAARKAAAKAGRVTGFLVEMPDGRSATYLTREEAEAARQALGSPKPVREVYAVG